MRDKNGILAASGYSPLNYLSTPIFVDSFLAQYYPESIAGKITTTSVEGTSIRLGQEYVFKERPQAKWFDARKNMLIDYDELHVTSKSMLIGRARGFALKVDQFDVDAIDNFSSYITAWKDDAKQKLSMYIDSHLLNTMLHSASVCNKGTNAGLGPIPMNFGASGAPLTITPQNILRYLMMLGSVLDRRFAPKNDRFVVLPDIYQIVLAETEMFSSQCASGMKPLVLGSTVPDIAGFKVYFSSQVPSYNDPSGVQAFPVIAGCSSATELALGMTDVESNLQSVETWGRYWRGRVVFDWKVVRPEFLAALYTTVTF